MKKLILLALLAPLLAQAAPNDLVISQRNADDSGLAPSRRMSPPADGSNAVLAYTGGTTQLPTMWALGAGLNLSAGVLSVTPPTWSSVTGKPTTLSGYGITDGVSPSALAGKFNTPTGTTAQYVRGDGSLGTLPAARRIETYSATTDATGSVTVTYPSAYSAVPNVQPGPPTAANQVWTVVASSTTGFTLRLQQRASVNLAGLEVLLAATQPVVGAQAQVMVVAQ